ncbi:MAG: ROK family protein [Firmicutes bacterium]|nr:ROK family protein [Bacillota bacterium]
MKSCIVLDIGGTAIKYALAEPLPDGRPRLTSRGQLPSEGNLGGGQLRDKALRIIGSFLEKEGRDQILGAAISTAGMVDPESGTIVHSGPTIPDYEGVCYKEAVEQAFGLPCEVENDVNCAGLSEYLAGAGQGAQSMLCLTVGTGIGGCAVIDGKVLHGFCSAGCEVGYLHMRGSCFEKLGAASILSEKVAAAKHEPAGSWDGIRIFAAAKQQDPDCLRAIDEMCDVLGEGIANLCYVLNPEVVVLGGGIMAQKELLGPKLRQSLDRYLIPYLADRTKLRFAMQGNDAGMAGAFYHFQRKQKERSALG